MGLRIIFPVACSPGSWEGMAEWSWLVQMQNIQCLVLKWLLPVLSFWRTGRSWRSSARARGFEDAEGKRPTHPDHGFPPCHDLGLASHQWVNVLCPVSWGWSAGWALCSQGHSLGTLNVHTGWGEEWKAGQSLSSLCLASGSEARESIPQNFKGCLTEVLPWAPLLSTVLGWWHQAHMSTDWPHSTQRCALSCLGRAATA